MAREVVRWPRKPSMSSWAKRMKGRAPIGEDSLERIVSRSAVSTFRD